jgi:hypothetical protein
MRVKSLGESLYKISGLSLGAVLRIARFLAPTDARKANPTVFIDQQPAYTETPNKHKIHPRLSRVLPQIIRQQHHLRPQHINPRLATTPLYHSNLAVLEMAVAREFLFFLAGELHRAITFGVDVPSL